MSANDRNDVDGRFNSPFYIVFFSLFGWIVAGYAFFMLIKFKDVIGNYFFHTDNPADIHYVIFGIIALSLLARFVGGMVFGRMSDKKGRLFVIRIVLISITLLVIFSIPLSWENSKIESMVPIFFIVTRVLIGFFTGGLWPTGGVYALEKLQHYYENNPKTTSDKQLDQEKNITSSKKIIDFILPHSNNSTQIKTLGWQSSWIQSGFQWSILLEVLLLYFFLHTNMEFTQIWEIISGIGVILGIIGIWWSLKMKESEQWVKMNKKIKNYDLKRIFDIKIDSQNEIQRKTIVNLWLIMAGVMYLFYSTMAIIGGYFPRSDYLENMCTEQSLIQCNWAFGAITFTIISLAAHIVPGHHLTRLWNITFKDFRDNNSEWRSYGILEKIRKFVGHVFWRPSKLYPILLELDIKRLPFFNRFTNEKYFIEKAASNRDSVIILSHAYLALYCALMILGFFFVVYLISGETTLIASTPSEEPINIILMGIVYAMALIIIGFILFVVTSTWSIIPSMLSSMFPIARRNFWTSAIYTGGTIVGFAAPFVSIQIIQQYDHVWLLIPLILGCISIVIGARSIITSSSEIEELNRRPGDILH